ncbi:MAG: hypothetical protein JSR32_00225 [Proteobacteria bacterium]|nr:hypothetical protein [Pseudomonadota bacterium]
MTLISPKQRIPEWIKYFAMALICALVAVDGISSVMADQVKTVVQQTDASDSAEEPRLVIRSDSVAARLGGYYGILAFLQHYAVPALLADNEIASFFGNLTETPTDISQCLAMMLDHDLGGSSRHDGTVVETGHQCRGSMPKIHKGRNIPDKTITKFIQIIGHQAELAGVSPADIKAVAKVLEQNRAGVRNK